VLLVVGAVLVFLSPAGGPVAALVLTPLALALVMLGWSVARTSSLRPTERRVS
jgi:hypothetical protein